MPVKRITDDQRAELREAVLSGTIDNFSAYADAFAATHGLNRNTVRSAVTRLRREMREAVRIPRDQSRCWADDPDLVGRANTR